MTAKTRNSLYPPQRFPASKYYVARGLFELAKNHATEMEKAENELKQWLGMDELHHISDAIFGESNGSFDKACKLANFTFVNVKAR